MLFSRGKSINCFRASLVTSKRIDEMTRHKYKYETTHKTDVAISSYATYGVFVCTD